jgi:uncharacterized protein YcgI (DUF1989 family)
MENIDPALIVHDEIIPGGSYWHRIINRWQTLRIIAPEGSRESLFFAQIAVDPDGKISYVSSSETPGTFVDLRGACSCESNSVRFGLDKNINMPASKTFSVRRFSMVWASTILSAILTFLSIALRCLPRESYKMPS